MCEDAFVFLRATNWRWAETILEVCPDLAGTPAVLAVGDIHLENFGTWTDKEGRLCWGVNDYDEAAEMPYILDLVRLATSAVLAAAPSQVSLKAICTSVLEGYAHGLEAPEAFVLDREHLWLRSPMPEIPDEPTRDDALAALALLDELISKSPFADEPSKSVALSGLITPCVRGAFAVSPMHLVTAPVAGSGKWFLWDMAAAISSGQQRMPVIAAGNEEETEKRLTGVMLTGQPLISIDNVNGELKGDFLCQAIEQHFLDVRPLGRSNIVRVSRQAA